MGCSFVSIFKNLLTSSIIIVFQTIITGICIVIYLLTNAIFIVFIIPIIEIIILTYVNKLYFQFQIKNISCSLIISSLFFLTISLYMMINQSLLGFLLFLAIYILGFGIADIFYIILLSIKNKTGD